MDIKLLHLAVQHLSDRLEKMEEENKRLNQEIQELKRNTIHKVEEPPVKEIQSDELLVLKDAIRLLNISRSGFLRMVNEGLVKPIRYNLRTVRYSRKELLGMIRR